MSRTAAAISPQIHALSDAYAKRTVSSTACSIDLIVDRREMRDKIAAMLAVMTKKPKAA